MYFVLHVTKAHTIFHASTAYNGSLIRLVKLGCCEECLHYSGAIVL